MNSKKNKRLFMVMTIFLLMGIPSQSYAVDYLFSLPLEGTNCGTVSGITICWDSSTTNAEGEMTFLSDLLYTVPSIGTAYKTGEFYNHGNIWGPGALLFATGNTKLESTGTFLNSGTIKGITELHTTAGSFINTGSVEADIIINEGMFNAAEDGHVVANQELFNYGIFLNGGIITADLLFNISVFSSSGSINSNELSNSYGANLSNSGTLKNTGTITNWTGATLTNDGTLKTATLDNRPGGTIENNGDLDATLIVNNIYGTFKNSGDLTYGTIDNFGDFSTSGEIRRGDIFNNDGTLTINKSGSFTNSYDALLTNNNGGKVIVESGGELINTYDSTSVGNFVNKNGGMLTVNGEGKLTNEYFGRILNESGGVITTAGF
ncbi:MAG: hypothetical protein V2I62_08775, partial [Bacteroidales bacterium]|nr:hypothetical protein [Bacteroidales bacterium]